MANPGTLSAVYDRRYSQDRYGFNCYTTFFVQGRLSLSELK